MLLSRVRFVSVVFLTAVLATLALSAPAGATPTKPFSLVICALGSSESCAPSPTSGANAPAAVPAAGSSIPMTATFTNENKPSGIQIGSANLNPPAGFTVNTATLTTSCSGCTVAVVGNVVQLRGLNVPPSGTVSISMTVDDGGARGCPVPNQLPSPTNSPCAWTVEVKQSNDFSGPPGNDLTLDSGTSAPYTAIGHLTFAAQPHNATLGQAITDTDYTPPPAGGPVTVEVADSGGTVIPSFVGPIGLSLNTPNNPLTNPNTATLGGTSTEPASAGVAKFADLTINEPGNGYTLTASSTGLPPTATSTPFDVQQAASLCKSNQPCGTEATSNNWSVTDGGIDVQVNSSSGAASELAESVDFGSWSSATRTLECGGASAHFAYQAFTTPRPLTATVITTDLELTKSNLNASVGAQQICLAQTSPFTAKNEATNPPSLIAASPVTLPDGTQGYAGLEPDCGTKSNQVPQGTGPCVTSRSGTVNKHGSGGTLTISDSTPSDRWIN